MSGQQESKNGPSTKSGVSILNFERILGNSRGRFAWLRWN